MLNENRSTESAKSMENEDWKEQKMEKILENYEGDTLKYCSTLVHMNRIEER